MISPPRKATTFRELRRVCRPRPLEGDYLEAFFVETDQARNPHQHTRELVKTTLDEYTDARILFYGHRGCGKSTELNKLITEFEDRFLTVQFSAEKHMNMFAACAEDLLLLICERVLQAAREARIRVNERALAGVRDYFAEVTETKQSGHDTTAGVQAQAGAGVPAVLGSLLSLFGQFKGEIRYNAHSNTTTVAQLRKRPAAWWPKPMPSSGPLGIICRTANVCW